MELINAVLQLTDSLHKQFPEEKPNGAPLARISALWGESVSFQALLYQPNGNGRGRVKVVVEGAPGLPAIQLRRVITMPVRLAAFAGADEAYLRKTPGLYPDRLEAYHGTPFWFNNMNETYNFWMDLRIPEELPAGEYPITVRVISVDGVPGEREELSATVVLTVVAARLPQQELICTQWFHSDCLADYYNVPVFSEEYWRITEQFMRAATACGTNMILTPTFTPALDTAVGLERTTVQLVDVTAQADGRYVFGFDKLRRWIDTAHRAGFRYFEIAHLFTQWGAKFCPKVMAQTEKGYRRIFGWDTPADGPEYMNFLSQYLPALTAQLYDWGVADRCRFHLSDEPNEQSLAHYLKLRRAVDPYLKDFVIMDALSRYEFYSSGAVDEPVVSLNHLEPFLEHHISPLWVYYCCGQGDKHVSNRFIAMSSARNRQLGFQMYLERAKGFLQWGFNFYNGNHSEERINPFVTTDGNATWPAGDPFIVYPGPGGQPEGSIRQMVFGEALQDQRACSMLERYTGRAHVCDLIREAGITGFFCCPDSETLLRLRERINREIAEAVASSM